MADSAQPPGHLNRDTTLDPENELDRRDLDDLGEDEPPHAPATLIERRRAQKAIFESWTVSGGGQEALKFKAEEERLLSADDETLSIHNLMAKQGVQIIKNPRQYQWELFQRAQKENTIAVLDTGSGKTLIAVLLLRFIIDQELERRAAGDEPRISFFLVASVTLVFQQHAVLEKNIDHRVEKVCGTDRCENWQKAKWERLFSENKVIVATADVLHQCLAHSYITMRQINLLVFDEAHHAKKNHAYARIVKDFYVTEPDREARPRIFGMTASPIDAKTDVVQAASELESLLHCKIATTTDMSLREAIKKPSEQVLEYPPLPVRGFETAMLKAIKARFGTPAVFEKVYEQSIELARHLGRWPADVYLANALSDKKLHRYELDTDKRYYYGGSISGNSSPAPAMMPAVTRSLLASSPPQRTDRPLMETPLNNIGVAQLDAKQALLRSIVEWVGENQSQFAKLQETGDLSPKVMELKTYLARVFERPSFHRCIVFVEARHTARSLHAVFSRVGPQHLKSGFLVGAKPTDIDEDNFTFRQQVMTLMKFRKGDINCLFATSVAEEGLDVPDCNLVIRFDMYRTMIQYVQSRGRARQSNSKFIHMIEKSNCIHAEILNQVRYQERAMRRFCEALPEDRRLEGDDDYLESLMAKEKSLRVYTEPSTGAKLTYGNALLYLANFVSAIPSESQETLHPTYIVDYQGQQFIAEVLLPANAPIGSAIGRVCTRKTLAKRSAAFEACIELRRKNYLNEHLMPVYQKKLPAMRNALLAVNMKKTNQYTMKVKPSVWDQTRGTLPSELWATIIDFPDGLEHPHQPIVLLTRTAIPQLPAFPVFLNSGQPSKVRSVALSQPLRPGEDIVQQLSTFTFRVFKDVFSKTYEEDAEQLDYWLAPGMPNSPETGDALTAIDWELVREVAAHEEYKWTPESPAEMLLNKLIVDPWDGSRKFHSKALCPELKPLDPVPEVSAKHRWMANILDYSNSLFGQTRARRAGTWNLQQPVFEAEKMLLRRNRLAAPDPKEVSLRTKAFLCPEPLKISVLPAAVAASCLVWPAIIWRVESYLIALEACNTVGVDCGPELALAALTKDSDNSSEHESQERINFRHGMGENYERLEFIGDTFLKTATTISTFVRNPNDNEFEFHVKRMLMLCNQNLFNVALDLKLFEYIRTMAFSRRLWYPGRLKLIVGKDVNKQTEEQKHPLGEKTIADVCEALIGAAYLAHAKPGDQWKPSHWQHAVRAVTKLVNSADHKMMEWSDYSTTYQKPAYQTGEVSASQRDLAEKVKLEHAYHFRYPRLLRSAFIHPSQPLMYEKVPNYQRLEFLGDALLDMASITYLFYRFPDKDPQWLTEHKMAMVSNKFLGAVSVNIGFYKHLRHSSSVLQHQIDVYVTELLEAKRTAGNARDYWTTVADPPKSLPDIVEAFVGAMFIDSDFDYGTVQDFFEKHVKWYFEDISIYDGFANNHPCTRFHKLLQTTYECQDYRLMAKELPNIEGTECKDVVAAVMVHGEIVAHSRGKSGCYARLRAAQNAIEMVEGLAPFEFRSRFGCNCSLREREEHFASDAAPAVDCNV